MGAVYLARERALEREVAIKVLPPALAGDEASRERFRREARTAANLSHPGIVPLHSFGETDGMLYFVMGYVRGQSLGARMAHEGRLPPGDVQRILAQLADALDYAHRKGVVHRDIKPDNVLLDGESGRAMLTDFGIARRAAHGATLTETGAIVGSPHYMSPEQASGERDLDGRSDLYSLGVMGFAMLAGRLPFQGATFRDVIVQHVTQTPPPLQALATDAPSGVVTAIMRCLAKDPTARWPDAAMLRSALQADDEDELAAAANVRYAVPAIGSLLVVDAVFAAYSWFHPSVRASAESSWFAIPLGIAGALAALTAAAAAMARSQGAPWRDMLHEALLPPRWWAWWYPNAWRSAEDVAVQRRIPAEIQKLRKRIHLGYMVIGTASGGSALLNGIFENSYEGGAGLATKWILIPLNVLGLGLMFSAIFGVRKWAIARGVPNALAQQFAFGGTADARFWRKPRHAALLLPEGPTALQGREEPQGPEAIMRDIVLCAGQLDSGGGTVGAESVSAARLAVEAIERIEREIATLASDASPEHIAALARRLAELGEAANDSPSRGELRAVLTQQRQLLARLTEQLERAVAQRARLCDLLRTLWLQVATLRADLARDSHVAPEITSRIRAIVTELSAHLDVADVLRQHTAKVSQ